jgi:hypothetical protein
MRYIMSIEGFSVYGVPLEELPRSESLVPSFLPSVCAFISQYSSCIGLFRQCGEHILMHDLGVMFAFPKAVMPACASVYDAAAFLNRWLRELPIPLLTPSVINANLDPSNPDSVRICLRERSPVVRRSFALICRAILDILAHADVNHMTFENMNFCFFDGIHQNSKMLDNPFPFEFFFCNAIQLLDRRGTDFRTDIAIKRDRMIQFDENAMPFNMQETVEAAVRAALQAA